MNPSDFFVFKFSLDNSCVVPEFLAVWMHSYDWLGTGLFPADSKIESISSFSERGVFLVYFSGGRWKLADWTKDNLGTSLLSRVIVLPGKCFS